MKASKFILLIGAEDSPLAALGPKLKELDFQVSLAKTTTAAMTFLERVTRLSLIAIDGALDGVDLAFYSEIKNSFENLPLVWLNRDTGEADFGLREPDAVFNRPLDPDAFTQSARDFLRDDFYPKSLTQTLVSASNAVMATTFQASVDVGEPWLKLTGTIPGNVNAFLWFMGDNARGHLIVSGHCDHLFELGLELGFEEEEGKRYIAKEVVSELSNQVVGRLKQDCDAYLGDIRLGVPLIFAGSDMDISYPSSKPSLCVEAADGKGKVHFEFSLQHDGKDSIDSLQDAGEVILF